MLNAKCQTNAKIETRFKCHPEQGEGSLTCQPNSYSRQGFFTEPTMNKILQSLCSFRMTTSERLIMTFLNLNLTLILKFEL